MSSTPRPLSNAQQALLDYALSFPEVRRDDPWGEPVAKVGKKVFAFLGRGDDMEVGLCVKLPHSAMEALEHPCVTPAGYGLGKHGWVALQASDPDEAPTPEVLHAWIEESYRAVALKRCIKALDARA